MSAPPITRPYSTSIAIRFLPVFDWVVGIGTHTARGTLISPNSTDGLDNLKAPTSIPSLAATFPPFRGPQHRRQIRDLPIPERLTRVARRLAHRGAMEPEGCAADELTRTRNLHRLHAGGIKEILGTLWAFRLLGYLPIDTVGRDYAEIVAIVAANTPRQ